MRVRSVPLLSAATLVLLVAAACGGGSGGPKASTGAGSEGGVTATTAAPASAPSAAAGQPVTVDVTAADFSFQSSLTTFKVGVRYHFVVHNAGAIAHELMIVKPIPPGSMSMAAMDKMAIGHIEEHDLAASATATLDVTFAKAYPPGTLELACHLGGHYEQGMHLPVVVEQ